MDMLFRRVMLAALPASEWAAANPILAAGEPAYETDTGAVRIGDGSTAYNVLPIHGTYQQIVDAQAAAEAAQEASETARDAAQGFKGDAETARDQALVHAGTAATEAQNAAAAVSYQAMGAVQAAYPSLTALLGAIPYFRFHDTDPSFVRRLGWTSWHNDPLAGVHLGERADEAAARAADDAATGAYFLRASDKKWYSLDDTSGITEVERGNRADLPNLMIAWEASRLITLNADAPDLPMWKVWDFTGLTITSVAARDGKIVVGTTTGVVVLDLAADRIDVELTYTAATTPALVNASVNAVTITVRPDAPIDPATGLPVPTIAVGTDGGLSVIGHDGVVRDSDDTGPVSDVVLVDQGVMWSFTGGVRVAFATWSDIYAGDGFGDRLSYTVAGGSNEFDLLTRAESISNAEEVLVFGGGTSSGNAVSGLMFHLPNYADQSKGMSALMTSTYLTGWMLDPVGCWLADTDDTDLVDTNIVPVDDRSGSSGVVAGDWATFTAPRISVVPGKVYSFSFDVTLTATGTYQNSRVGFGEPGVIATSGATYDLFYADDISNGVTKTITGSFTPTENEVQFAIRINGDGNNTAEYANLVLQRADADRSVNANPLTVVGTVTRTALPSGIVAYSGMSGVGGNWFFQPYNSDLDFGTGDFEWRFWVKDLYGGVPFSRYSADMTFRCQTYSDGRIIVTTSDGTLTAPAGSRPDNQWYLCSISRRNGVLSISVNGNEIVSGNHPSSVTDADGELFIGVQYADTGGNNQMSLVWMKPSATAPTPEQIRHIYESERHAFYGDLPVVLGGTSDAVRAQALDPVTGLLHVLTPDGHSTFNPRTFQPTAYEAGDWDWIAAHGGLVVKG